MSNYHLRRPPQDNMMTTGAMRFRRNWAVSENYAFALDVEQFVSNGSWKYGLDGHRSIHRSTITNPNAAPFYIANFQDAERDVLGAFVERSVSLTDQIGLDLGARVNLVSMDSERVSANLNPMNLMMGMPVMMDNMASMLATQFNNDDLSQSETNADWFARLSFDSENDVVWYVGAARKSRSPSYQERYLWLPLEATGGLADGKTYVGDPRLDPEVAHELELGFDYDGDGFYFYPRLFYKEVSDYIQGMPASSMLVNNFAQLMANMGMGSPDPLQFSNVDATFYGFDMESAFAINDRLTFRAIASMVRGERDDINDDLYRIAPDNIILALDYAFGDWVGSIESIHYADQDQVSNTNLEQATDGYSLLNLTGRVNVTSGLEIVIGVENVLDEDYLDHLSAYNRAYNPDIAMRERMPGLGRNFYGRLMWYF